MCTSVPGNLLDKRIWQAKFYTQCGEKAEIGRISYQMLEECVLIVPEGPLNISNTFDVILAIFRELWALPAKIGNQVFSFFVIGVNWKKLSILKAYPLS